MSQAKVDRYKAEKKNRKKEVKSNRRKKMLAKIIGPVVAAAVVVWIGFSGYKYYQNQQPTEMTEVNISAISDYISTLE